MSYLLFSNTFLKNIKKAAKSEKKTGHGKQTENLNLIAMHAGFQAWNNLTKHIERAGIIPLDIYEKVFKAVLITCPNTADVFVLSEFRAYLNSNFERLAEYSMPNPHSQNGYSHPSIDVKNALEAAYSKILNQEQLHHAIGKLMSDEDGWCLGDEDPILEFQSP